MSVNSSSINAANNTFEFVDVSHIKKENVDFVEGVESPHAESTFCQRSNEVEGSTTECSQPFEIPGTSSLDSVKKNEPIKEGVESPHAESTLCQSSNEVKGSTTECSQPFEIPGTSSVDSVKRAEQIKRGLLTLIANEEMMPIITFMKNKGLLKWQMDCNYCNCQMRWSKRVNVKDNYQWRCYNLQCQKYKCALSIRHGSFFKHSSVSLGTWLHLMHLWSIEESIKNASNRTSVSQKTVVDIYNCFREICQQYFVRHPIKLGGPGITLQAEESCFAPKPKHNRRSGPEKEVFGIVDTSFLPAVGYMQILENRDAKTIMQAISNIALPGSIIHTDEWQVYRNIQNHLDLQHATVNQNISFVERKIGVHSQAMQSYLNKHKQKIREMHGCSRHLLPTYLSEMMWRDRFYNDAFNYLCEHIKEQYM